MQIADLESPVTMVLLNGVIDSLTYKNIAVQLEQLKNEQRYNLVVDLSQVSYVSSTGWSIFLNNLGFFREHGGDIVLVGLAPEVLEIFFYLELDKLVSHFHTTEEAIGHFHPEKLSTRLRGRIKQVLNKGYSEE